MSSPTTAIQPYQLVLLNVLCLTCFPLFCSLFLSPSVSLSLSPPFLSVLIISLSLILIAVYLFLIYYYSCFLLDERRLFVQRHDLKKTFFLFICFCFSASLSESKQSSLLPCSLMTAHFPKNVKRSMLRPGSRGGRF